MIAAATSLPSDNYRDEHAERFITKKAILFF